MAKYDELVIELRDEVSAISEQLKSNGYDPMILGECDIDEEIMCNAERDVDCNDSDYYYDSTKTWNNLVERIESLSEKKNDPVKTVKKLDDNINIALKIKEDYFDNDIKPNEYDMIFNLEQKADNVVELFADRYLIFNQDNWYQEYVIDEIKDIDDIFHLSTSVDDENEIIKLFAGTMNNLQKTITKLL